MMNSLKKILTGIIGFVFMIFSTSLAASAATVDNAYTGDGRIYIALGVLGVAIVIVILMLVLKRKNKD